ncbi:O-succinylbenzoic acid--CoA ligase [Dokdonia sinensis]|uniref:O-succinylbenzoic acid--CoA ligase n=1 Tax=Dokdonia sinensis TaxID=2479847 RepID=A0A3M0GML4_9FLAO|nr:AMP-binding protein [Dokdonia sinensis]RMB63962.1 O-succinylbenzoic acid--CoA ligase [Dokdonia sinensis]
MVEFQDRYARVHPKFKLNGEKFSIEKLKAQAYEFIKEGEPYEEAVGNFLLDWLNDKRYITVHTSGSTGSPKAIKILKMHMVNSAKATAKHFDLPEKTTALLCLPAHFIAGKMMLVRALTQGWHIDMAQPKSNPLDNVYRRYDFCAMTPFQLDNSLGRMHLLKKLIVGGGAIAPSLVSRLQSLSTKIYETYGMTETVTHIAARRINPKKSTQDIIPFKTLPKVTISVDNRNCLVIKAPAVSTDPVITNDIVKLETFKKFIWLGRIDNVINSGGVKLHPEQIEAKLATMIDSSYFVAGVPDDALGEKLVLFVEQEEEFAFAKADLDLTHFEPYEFPKVIITLPRFERTDNGKLQRGQTVRKALEH